MAASDNIRQTNFFDRDAFVDFFLLFALVNVAVGICEVSFGAVGELSIGLRLALTVAAAGAIFKVGGVTRNREDAVAIGFPDPVVHDLRTGVLNRQFFFSHLDLALKRGTHGFLLLVHANDIDAIEKRFGSNVAEYFLATLLSRFDPTIQEGDILGRLDRDTFAAFFSDRTQDEISLIGRRLCGATLLPLGDSVDRAQLSACVGYTEVTPNEPILETLERANEALKKAQQPGSERLEMWTAPKSKSRVYTTF